MSANRQLHDRRYERLDLPPCPECQATEARVMSRTNYVVYVQCAQCHLLWSVPKPGVAQPGS